MPLRPSSSFSLTREGESPPVLRLFPFSCFLLILVFLSITLSYLLPPLISDLSPPSSCSYSEIIVNNDVHAGDEDDSNSNSNNNNVNAHLCGEVYAITSAKTTMKAVTEERCCQLSCECNADTKPFSETVDCATSVSSTSAYSNDTCASAHGCACDCYLSSLTDSDVHACDNPCASPLSNACGYGCYASSPYIKNQRCRVLCGLCATVNATLVYTVNNTQYTARARLPCDLLHSAPSSSCSRYFSINSSVSLYYLTSSPVRYTFHTPLLHSIDGDSDSDGDGDSTTKKVAAALFISVATLAEVAATVATVAAATRSVTTWRRERQRWREERERRENRSEREMRMAFLKGLHPSSSSSLVTLSSSPLYERRLIFEIFQYAGCTHENHMHNNGVSEGDDDDDDNENKNDNHRRLSEHHSVIDVNYSSSRELLGVQ